MKAKLLTILGIILFSLSFTACSDEEIIPQQEVEELQGGGDGEVDFEEEF